MHKGKYCNRYSVDADAILHSSGDFFETDQMF